MVRVQGGTFRMGSDKHYPEEAPVHRVTVDAFFIDPTPVTNRQFKDRNFSVRQQLERIPKLEAKVEKLVKALETAFTALHESEDLHEEDCDESYDSCECYYPNLFQRALDAAKEGT